MPNMCCPPGSFYIDPGGGVTPFCCNMPMGSICITVPTEPIPCPSQTCCPQGSIWIDEAGGWSDPNIGTGTILNANKEDFYETCAILSNIGPAPGGVFTAYAMPSEPISPIDCPCCQQGFAYSSDLGLCVGLVGSSIKTAPTVPCIDCVCDVPEPVPCTTCGVDTLPIAFVFNPNVKHCQDCNPVEESTSPFTSFIADRLITPLINFIRR